jgi:hypothetical protein
LFEVWLIQLESSGGGVKATLILVFFVFSAVVFIFIASLSWTSYRNRMNVEEQMGEDKHSEPVLSNSILRWNQKMIKEYSGK